MDATPPANPNQETDARAAAGAGSDRVPEPLLRKLHEAITRFHDARVKLESSMDLPEYDRQERVNESEEVLRQAEQELEKIDKEIEQTLSPEVVRQLKASDEMPPVSPNPVAE